MWGNKGKSRALLETTAVLPMSYNAGSYSLAEFGGRGCDGAVGNEEGGSFEYILNSDFPGGSGGKIAACNAEDLGSICGSGKPPGGGNGNPLQYSGLENSMDEGAGLQSMGSP